MIRLTALLRRNPALSRTEFDHHWRTTHADLMSGLPTVEQRILRYEQHSRTDDGSGLWTGSPDVDGMAVQWYEGLDDLVGLIADPAYRSRVVPDEQHLLDLRRSVFVVTSDPRVIIDRHPAT